MIVIYRWFAVLVTVTVCVVQGFNIESISLRNQRPFRTIQQPSKLQLSSKNSQNDDKKTIVPFVPKNVQSSLSVFAVASTILLSSLPALASNEVASNPLATETLDVSELVKSLSPATASRPQIPFPTQEALQKAAEASSSKDSRKRQPVPQENLLQENSYTLPALISLDSKIQRARPYNGADVLVLKVWKDNPQAGSSLGGAKIPIGALVGGFPVRVSLGPQNAAQPHEWKETLSSQSLWVTAAICRETGNDSSSVPVSSNICSREHSLPVLEASGFSKFINISAMVQQQGTSSSTASTSASGLRAPVSLVLGQPTR